MKSLNVRASIGLLLLLTASWYASGQVMHGRVSAGIDSLPLARADVVWQKGPDDPGLWVQTDRRGYFELSLAAPAEGVLLVFHRGYQTWQSVLPLPDALMQEDGLRIHLHELAIGLPTLTVGSTSSGPGLRPLRAVEGTAIYAGRKTEVIDLEALLADKSGNNARQLYGRVAGLHVWESGGAGLQLGVGGRGLSPNRTAHFNTRQNGMDIAADALGYPESYYTPPAEALSRIEVVRGAASLQYGPQFGGLLQFVLRDAPKTDGIAVRTRQSLGSYGFVSSYTDVGWRKGAWSAFGFYQFRHRDGWRPNSSLQQHSGHVSLAWSPNERHEIKASYTHMQYLAQQAGGLTDAAFAADPRQSIRARNWFAVRWNVASLQYQGQWGQRANVDLRAFNLVASKDALGILGQVTRSDPGGPRDLLSDRFRNAGAEARWLQRFGPSAKPHVFLLGARLYQGQTLRQQGDADPGYGPEFVYLNETPNRFDYVFPSWNAAVFAEQVIRLGKKWSLSPGIRAERIRTDAEGTYRLLTTDLAGNPLVDTLLPESLARDRSFILLGLRAARQSASGEWYGGIAQNYRGITFNDLRVTNPSFRVDENLTDEHGFNAEVGWRGTFGDWLRVDANGYALVYRNRIGEVLAKDSVTYRSYRLRTNVADSRTIGLEAYLETDWMAMGALERSWSWTTFVNLGLAHARYVSSDETAFDGKQVEGVPPMVLRAGMGWRWKAWNASLQGQWVQTHFSDATNASFDPSATAGIIPAYAVLDASLAWQKGIYSIQASINNLSNSRYFTRRATGYPGPGILPADGINAVLTFGVDL